MSKHNINQSRRRLLGSGLGLSVPAVWTTPAIQMVALPAHAEMSPVIISCPAIVIDDVFITTPSPQDQNNPVCGISFDIFSADAEIPIEVVSIETTTLADNVTVTFDENLGQATMTEGIRVNWTGPAAGAPFCNADSEPFDDMTFTITAECEPDTSTPVTETITLLELYALAEFGNPV